MLARPGARDRYDLERLSAHESVPWPTPIDAARPGGTGTGLRAAGTGDADCARADATRTDRRSESHSDFGPRDRDPDHEVFLK